jgi:hypothetical protein
MQARDLDALHRRLIEASLLPAAAALAGARSTLWHVAILAKNSHMRLIDHRRGSDDCYQRARRIDARMTCRNCTSRTGQEKFAKSKRGTRMGGIKSVQEAERDRINECIDVVCNRFESAVRPVYGSNDRKLATHIGSATLLKLGGTPLIGMAAHVVDENKHTALYVGGETHLIPIEASFEITSLPPGGRNEDRYDFAVAKLSPATFSELGNVGYIADDDLLLHDALTRGHLYVLLGYPNSKNKKIDHANKVARSELWKYGSHAGPHKALEAKLKVSGKTHLFIGFDRQHSRAADGRVVNSIGPRGISGGAVFDAGNVADPDNLRPDAHIRGRLAAIVIEYHPQYGRIVATRIGVVLDAIAERLSIRVERTRF